MTTTNSTKRSTVIAFSGGIGSGKSTLSSAIARELDWPRVGFGDYLRAEANRRELRISRTNLQSLGETLIDEGWEPFCRAVLAQASWQSGQPLVIDGIRHPEAIETLRPLVAPSKLLLVFIDVDRSIREARLRDGEMSATEKMQQYESHSTELHMKRTLPQMADYTVQGTMPLPDSVSEVVAWLESLHP